MIKLQDLPEPGFLVAPGNYDKWAEAHLAIAEVHEAKCVELHKLIGNGITQADFDELDRHSEALAHNVIATILFAALEVEATLNFQGVVRLGEDYYKQNLERSSAEKKIAGIVAATTQHLVENHDEVCKVVRRVFEERNKAAHPKTKSYAGNQKINIDDPTIKKARAAVGDMKRFLELFRGLVPWNFHATLRDRDVDTDPPTPEGDA